MSHELVTLHVHDVNKSLTIKQCFNTSMYLYDNTNDPFLRHLRYMMHKLPDFPFMYWIKDILFMSSDMPRTFHVRFPKNTCKILIETISLTILVEDQNIIFPDVCSWNKTCVPEFDLYVPYTSIFDFEHTLT